MSSSSPEQSLPVLRQPEWLRRSLGDVSGKGVRVAVIDSGWDRKTRHPQIRPGVCFVDSANDYALSFSSDDHDRNGHGTACADLILRVAPRAEVTPVRIFGRELDTTPAILEAALLWAAAGGFDLVNVSAGTRRNDAVDRLAHACMRLGESATVVIASGANSGGLVFPACFHHVIGVTRGRFADPFDFTYRPENVLECVANGSRQPVRSAAGRGTLAEGSSLATAQITGILALAFEHCPIDGIADARRRLAGLAECAAMARDPQAALERP